MNFLLAALVLGANAHNWLQSLSRTSPSALTLFPVVASPTGKPQVQVIAGQKFQIEWVTGHSGDHYFIFLAAEDAKMMSNHVSGPNKMLEMYVNGAPAAQNKTTHGTAYQKFHRKLDESARQAYTHPGTNYTDIKYIVPHLKKGDAGYISRPSYFVGGISNSPKLPANDTYLRQAKYDNVNCPDCVNFDRRAFYDNPKYPWVIGIHRYRHAVGEPGRADVALFDFPAGTPPGNYIVHSVWQGYYDAIDVVVRNGTTPIPEDQIYFKPVPIVKDVPMVYRRIDHCMFVDASLAGSCKQIITDIRSCAIECDAGTALQCSGINVVPVLPQPDAYAGYANFSLLPPEASNPNCVRKPLLANATVNTRACYAVKARPLTDLTPPYEIFEDPADPRYYSVCWVRTSDPLDKAPPTPARPLEYLSDTRCKSCREAQLSTYDRYQPLYNLPDVCIDCDKDGPPLSSFPAPPNYNTPAPWKLKQKGRCLGINGEAITGGLFKCTAPIKTCVLRLYPANSIITDTSERDCYALAKAEPLCAGANLIMYDNVTNSHPRQCACYLNDACCGPCQVTSGWNLYNL